MEKGIRISHLVSPHLIYYTNGARPLGGKAKTVRLLSQHAQTPVQTNLQRRKWLTAEDGYGGVLGSFVCSHAGIPPVFMIMAYVPFPYNIFKLLYVFPGFSSVSICHTT
jgi:hypothetical protein